jgi:ubiquinone/menaquinone biosynthesis C-methylase UbiE
VDDVQQRFSREVAAVKWNDLYSRDTPVLEEVSFRQRRDYTVEQVSRHCAPGSRVLDLGCGTGPVLVELMRRGFECTGMDYSPDMLDFARQRIREAGFDDSRIQQGDCRKTPFADASFDAVVCLGVISYVENYEVVLAEMRRILKPGGLLVVSFRNKFNPVISDPVALGKVVVKWLMGRRDPEIYAIGQFLDHRVFLRKIQPLDFQLLEFRGMGFGPFRVAGRTLLGESAAVKLSNGVDAVVRAVHGRFIARWMADVSVWVYRSPGTAR